MSDVTPEYEEELERTAELRGFRYGFHDLLAAVDFEALKRSNDGFEAELAKESLIDKRTRELLFLAVCVAEQNEVAHLQVHMHAAVRAGSTEEELWELLGLVRSWVGLPATVKGYEAWRATFHPELPAVDRVSDLR